MYKEKYCGSNPTVFFLSTQDKKGGDGFMKKLANQKAFSFTDEELLLGKNTLEKLLIWYQKNHRDLPWRKTRDPYCIWISEIMLQQTRVEAVKEYYRRFLEALPTVSHLAKAEEEQVLKLWEGLGYYSRARNLKKAAGVIMEKHGGVFPSDWESVRKLPGIGDYTAGAILSIAFGQPVPAVDGNVLRVLSRVFHDESDILDPKTKNRMTELLRQVYPTEYCSEVTQSLMELGATVCVPNGEPKCGECPLLEICLTKAAGDTDKIPVKSKKTARKIEQKTVLILQSGEELAIRKRTQKGLLHGMWEPIHVEGHLSEEDVKANFPKGTKIKRIGTHRHIFTHIEWDMVGYLVAVSQKAEGYQWVTREELASAYAIPKAFQPFF